ncbi:MAG: hypothetical protein MJ169_07010 [Treponema sp.]|nr:hypothetical protein [Treponema sp.]
MGIQPIDLQTMYSQMSNIAGRVASEQHGAATAQANQQLLAMQQTAENIKTVQKTAENESQTNLVKEDGHNGQSAYGSASSKKQSSENDSQSDDDDTIRENYLGHHINILR